MFYIKMAPTLKNKDILFIYDIFQKLEEAEKLYFYPFKSFNFSKVIFCNSLENENKSLRDKFYKNDELFYDLIFEDIDSKNDNEEKNNKNILFLFKKNKDIILSNINNQINLSESSLYELISFFNRIKEERKKEKLKILSEIKNNFSEELKNYKEKMKKKSNILNKKLSFKDKKALLYYFLYRFYKVERSNVSYRVLLSNLFSSFTLDYVSMQIAGLLDLHNKAKIKRRRLYIKKQLKNKGKKILFSLLTEYNIETLVFYIINELLNNKKIKRDKNIKKILEELNLE